MARASITKDQQKELMTVLKKFKVPQASIEALISSTHGSNTYKAFRQGKKITSVNGEWVINFASKWAKPVGDINTSRPAEERAVQKNKAHVQESSEETIEVPTIDESMLPDAPAIEIDMPDLGSDQDHSGKAPAAQQGQNLIMVSFQLEKEYLLEMQKIAAKQGININMLSRLAIKRFLGK
jgi:hypothetical protein